MRVMVVMNQKGGVGKTCTAQNLPAGLARRGRRVLAVDLDPQANLSEGFGIQPEAVAASTYDVLIKGVPLAQIRVQVDGLDLAPANVHLAGAEVLLAAEANGAQRLQASIRALKGAYDYVVIDCPPALGQLTINALYAATEVLVPVQPEFYALRGLRQLLESIEKVRARRPEFRIVGILGTQVDMRKNLTRTVLDAIRKQCADQMLNTVIRDNVALAEASATGQSIFQYQPGSHGAEDYAALAAEVIKQERRKA